MQNSKGQYLADACTDEAPPPYVELAQAAGSIQVQVDGRIDLDFNSKLARRLSKLLVLPQNQTTSTKLPQIEETKPWAIKLNIVIQVVGSRGDVQPFVALGNSLQKHGHRVRMATHNVFENFVRQSNLEFYPIGGDPTELMAYMVKNPGLIPSMKSLRGGEIQRNRLMVAEMLNGCWNSCVKPDTRSGDPFVADVIVANPPSFAHVHCAQALSIPLHLCFTMPWTPTSAFPHPLANIKVSSVEVETSNYLSYLLVEWMTWQGVGDLINSFRENLDLEAIPYSEGPTLASSLKIPSTYCWSPALVPKPADWSYHIDVCGFFFRDTPIYTPPSELSIFLEKPGPPIVYIGFGSIVIDDPQSLTEVILDAVRALGVRAVISRGWSKLGGIEVDNVYYLDDCPHEWLFQKVSAVVHHGGAGTTACGLRNGKPTMIVPFFGDQRFWGEMMHRAGTGPAPIPHKALNAKNLAEGLAFCLTKEATFSAENIAMKMSSENGVKTAVRSFHTNLPLEHLRCDLLPDQPAAWRYKHGDRDIKLSKLAAELLLENKKVDRGQLKLVETKPIEILNRRWEPVSAISSAYVGVATDIVQAQVGMFTKPYEEYKKVHAQNTNEDIPRRTQSKQPDQVPYFQTLQSPDGISSSASLAGSAITNNKHSNTASAMARASGKSAGQMFVAAGKGTLVDVPLAMAEGMRAVPRLYGEEVKSYEVRGWKSGMAVGGKSLGLGIAEGLAELVVQPYKGGKKEGAIGVAKGVGKGTLGMVSKIAGGAIGVWAYPAQGIAKSIFKTAHTSRRKEIEAAKKEEGVWMMKKGLWADVDVTALVIGFDVLRNQVP